jgi:hypothetical protein
VAPFKPKGAIAALKPAIEQCFDAHFGPMPEMGRAPLRCVAAAPSMPTFRSRPKGAARP